MSLFRFKKWYFDVITEQGDVLYAYFIVYRLAAVGRAILSAHLAAADGRHVRDSLTVPAPAITNDERVDFGRSILEKTTDGYHFRLDLPQLAVDLRYGSQGAWRPNPKGVLFKRGRRTLSWDVPLVRASVSGTLALGPKQTDVRGTGYHDLVWTDIPPWRLPIAELLWGRAHFSAATLVFNQLTTREDGVLQNVLVKVDGSASDAQAAGENGKARPRLRWIDDRQFQLRESGGLGSAVLSHPAFCVSLEERRILEESVVSTPERIGWAPLRKALDGLSGQPTERKILSEARLDLGGGIERGLAIHERVLWNWKPGKEGA